jgi:hypothetical protein
MTSIADGSVIIQFSTQSVPCPAPWFGEVALLVQHLRKQGVLSTICEQVRFARRRMGSYEVIDFLAVQIALCQKFRTHAGKRLREIAALCGSFHGSL